MTRIDFYITEDARPQARERAACRLVEKAWTQNHRIFVHTSSKDEARRIDELLWTFKQSSFLPHAMFPDSPDDSVNVLIGDGAIPTGETDVLINLTEEVPIFYVQFDRVAEFVNGREEARAKARDRFRTYREHGCAIESHNV